MSNAMYFGMQGLGDHISANGLVRCLLKNFETVTVPVWSHYSESIKFMYRDCPRVIVKEIISGKEVLGVVNIVAQFKPDTLFVIGPELPTDVKILLKNKTNLVHYTFTELLNTYGNNYDCHQLYYLGTGISFNSRFTDFYIERDLDRENNLFNKLHCSQSPYIFVHDDPNRGYVIQNSSSITQIRNDYHNLIFDYGKVIEEAKEVHCMESSFRCYIETLQPKGSLFLHHYVRNTSPFIVNGNLVPGCSIKNWNVIL